MVRIWCRAQSVARDLLIVDSWILCVQRLRAKTDLEAFNQQCPAIRKNLWEVAKESPWRSDAFDLPVGAPWQVDCLIPLGYQLMQFLFHYFARTNSNLATPAALSRLEMEV